MKYLIIDDEPIARVRLREMLGRIDPSGYILEAENGEEAMSIYEQEAAEVLLVDIRMPGISGIELAYHLSALDNPPAVIFTTAYNEYALEAFEANAIDYLLKPIQQDRLKRALAKADPITKSQGNALKEGGSRSHIAVNQKGKIKLVPLHQICYFRAENKYVAVRTRDARYLINETLNQLEEDMDDEFIRVHRNALISTRFLEGLEKIDDNRWCVLFQDIDDKLEISRRQTPTIRRWLRNKPI
ncbi:MAG: LytTR family DNA-binding domain-containing protein [Pseudomonadota bacterium]